MTRKKLVPVHVKQLIEAAADFAQVTPETLLGPGRYDRLPMARQAVMVALRRAGLSYPRIGRLLGSRDHTTVVYGLRRAKSLMRTSGAFYDLVNRLEGIALRRPTFPYPGHRTMAEVMADEARQAA